MGVVYGGWQCSDRSKSGEGCRRRDRSCDRSGGVYVCLGACLGACLGVCLVCVWVSVWVCVWVCAAADATAAVVAVGDDAGVGRTGRKSPELRRECGNGLRAQVVRRKNERPLS